MSAVPAASQKILSGDALAKLAFFKELPVNFTYDNTTLEAALMGLYSNVSTTGQLANRQMPSLQNDAACVETAMMELSTLLRKTRLPSTIDVYKMAGVGNHGEAYQAIVEAAKVLDDTMQRDYPAEHAAADKVRTRDRESRL